VLPPSIHPDTKRPYSWDGKGDWRNLPILPDNVRAVWELLIQAHDLRESKSHKYAAKADRENVEQALEFLDPDMAYDDWLAIGMALHNSNEEWGFHVWDEWSAKGNKYEPGICQDKWNTFAPDGGISLGTLFYMAQEAGYVMPERKRKPASSFIHIKTLIESYNGNIPNDGLYQIITTIADSKDALKPTDFHILVKELQQATGLTKKDLRDSIKASYIPPEGELDTEDMSHVEIALALREKLLKETGGRLVGYGGAFYHLDPTTNLWKSQPLHELYERIGTEYKDHSTCRTRQQYHQVAKLLYDMCEDQYFFSQAPDGIACYDGNFYQISATGKLVKQPIKPEHRMQFASEYKPIRTKPTAFLAMIERAFDSPDKNAVKAQTKLLQEVFGAIVVGLLPGLQRAVLFKGIGASSKSVITKVITGMIPKELTCSVTPYSWDREYYLATLMGKVLNVVGELPNDRPVPAAPFKNVIGGDLLSGRHPTHRVVSFVNTAAHLFSSNYYVPTRDYSEGFFRRWIVIHFLNQVPVNERIPEYEKYLLAEEGGRILHWALEGAMRLVKQDKFTDSPFQEQALDDWGRESSSVLAFLHDDDAVELDKDGKSKRSETYALYRAWCRSNSRKPKTKHHFFEEMQSLKVAALGIDKVYRNGTHLYTGLKLMEKPFDLELKSRLG
jgi:phage/plasmid-associated DNA primase